MELLEVVHDLVPEGDEVAVHLITQSDAETCVRQAENLDQIVIASPAPVWFSPGSWITIRISTRAVSQRTRAGKSPSIAAWTYSRSSRAGRFRWNRPSKERLTRGAEISYVKVWAREFNCTWNLHFKASKAMGTLNH